MYAMIIPEESTTKNPCVELSFAPVESVEAMGGGETRYLVAERGRTSQNNSLSVLFNTSLSVFCRYLASPHLQKNKKSSQQSSPIASTKSRAKAGSSSVPLH